MSSVGFINSSASNAQGAYQAFPASDAPSASKTAPADSSSTASVADDQDIADRVTYRNACGDTVTFSGTVVVNRSGREAVGQPMTSDCDPTQAKLAAAYSAY